MLDALLGVTERRSVLDNPNVSLDSPEAYDYLTGSTQTDAGINVSPRAALRLPPVWQAVNMISGDVAKLPLDVFEKGPEDSREVAKSHPAQKLVHDIGNPETTALEVWETAMVHALIWNSGYVYIDRLNNGTPVGLYNLLPDRTAPEIINGRRYFMTETIRRDGSPWIRPLSSADVLHVKGISLDGICGHDKVEAAKQSWAIEMAKQKFIAKFFKNGVRTGGILELPIGMNKPVADKVEEGFKKNAGEDNWFKTAILRDGAKFHQNGFSPEAAQMTELSQDGVRDIARWFNLAPSRLGVIDSVSHNSKSEDNRSYLETTLDIWLKKIAGQCNLRLLTQQQRDAGMYFEHNTAALLRMALNDRYQAYSLAYGRWLNRNAILRLENMPSSGPEGDIYVNTPVVGPSAGGAEKLGNDKPRGPAKKRKRPPIDAPRVPVTDKTIQLRRLVFTLADHARKKSGNPKAFLEFVDGNLSFHRQRSANVDDAATWLDRAQATLKQLAESNSANDLPAAVEAAMNEFELSCP